MTSYELIDILDNLDDRLIFDAQEPPIKVVAQQERNFRPILRFAFCLLAVVMIISLRSLSVKFGNIGSDTPEIPDPDSHYKYEYVMLNGKIYYHKELIGFLSFDEYRSPDEEVNELLPESYVKCGEIRSVVTSQKPLFNYQLTATNGNGKGAVVYSDHNNDKEVYLLVTESDNNRYLLIHFVREPD